MPPAVSVALCSRNGARYLPAQVRSICTQEPPPVQIVLSDDGSSDDSVAVVRRTLEECGAASTIELTVFENAKPLGVARNFEQAIRACRADLIALSDQDDVWHAGKLARMTTSFEANPKLLLLHTDARLVDARLEPLGLSLFQALEVRESELAAIAAGRAFDVYLRRNLVTGATTMFRRGLLDAALPFSQEWIHDEWLGAIAAATGSVEVLPEPLIDYRQHGGNQIGAKRLRLADKLRKAMDRRGTKHADRLRRAEALLARLLSLKGLVPASIVSSQREKVEHQRFRAGLPASRIARLLPVLAEAMRGRYDRYGRGMQAIAQDLLERG